MRDLSVRIEISGETVTVGNIHGENPDDACFSYAPDYLRRPIYDDTLRRVRLAPAYDMISTVVYDESTWDMSFFIGGEVSLNKINTICFERATVEAGIGKKLAIARYDKLRSEFKTALISAKDQLISEGFSGSERLCKRIMSS